MYTLEYGLGNRAETVRIGGIVARWCKRTFGVNKRRKFAPIWSFQKSDQIDTQNHTTGVFHYWDNEVIIYWNNVQNIEELIRVCIHEWTHQNQPLTTHYDKQTESYDNNKYEIEARKAEDTHYLNCWGYISTKLN